MTKKDIVPGLSIIAAVARNGVIGKGGDLPWKLPGDLKHFMSTTMGKPVIMGRKTYESMKRPLPGRTNIVLTRQADFTHEGLVIFTDFDDSVEFARENAAEQGGNEFFVIGGENIYELAIPIASKAYITRVDAEPNGDAFFPNFPVDEWNLMSDTAFKSDQLHSASYTIEIYER